MSGITLRQSDIDVQPIDPSTCGIANTDACTDVNTHAVWADLRAVGEKVVLATGCIACCEVYMNTLATSLPDGEDG